MLPSSQPIILWLRKLRPTCNCHLPERWHVINIYPDVGIELSYCVLILKNHISDYCLLESCQSYDFSCFQFLLLPSEAGTMSGNAPFCRALCADLANVNSHTVQLSICVALTKSSHRSILRKAGFIPSRSLSTACHFWEGMAAGVCQLSGHIVSIVRDEHWCSVPIVNPQSPVHLLQTPFRTHPAVCCHSWFQVQSSGQWRQFCMPSALSDVCPSTYV